MHDRRKIRRWSRVERAGRRTRPGRHNPQKQPEVNSVFGWVLLAFICIVMTFLLCVFAHWILIFVSGQFRVIKSVLFSLVFYKKNK